MKKIKKKRNSLILIPRILTFFLVVALYLFFSEIFSAEFQWRHVLYAFLPGSVYLLVAIVAWKNSGVGGMLFVFLAVILFCAEIIQKRELLANYILIGITFLIGLLFIIWREKKTY